MLLKVQDLAPVPVAVSDITNVFAEVSIDTTVTLVSEDGYADLVAICQPFPSVSCQKCCPTDNLSIFAEEADTVEELFVKVH